MRVEYAKNYDKEKVLEFCQNTFSWGDYIADVWNDWLKEGNLLVGYQNHNPIALCHASVNRKAKQVWIEGIRVHSDFRNQGMATKLVKKSESIARENNCQSSFMLIEVKNKNSIALAHKLNYKKKETWFFWSLNPKKLKSKIKFANYEKKIPPNLFSDSFTYVKSWRWLPLTRDVIKSLISKDRILFFENISKKTPFAIITDSEHFEGTLMVTLYSDSTTDLKQILNYIQNYAFSNNFTRIQILSKLKTPPKITDLKNSFSFYLMAKKI